MDTKMCFIDLKMILMKLRWLKKALNSSQILHNTFQFLELLCKKHKTMFKDNIYLKTIHNPYLIPDVVLVNQEIFVFFNEKYQTIEALIFSLILNYDVTMLKISTKIVQ